MNGANGKDDAWGAWVTFWLLFFWKPGSGYVGGGNMGTVARCKTSSRVLGFLLNFWVVLLVVMMGVLGAWQNRSMRAACKLTGV